MKKIQLINLKKQYEIAKEGIDLAIKNIIQRGRFIGGPELKEFENEFAKFCGKEYCIGVSSGTTAIHLALLAYGIGMGDEVITVPNTFIATVEPIIHVGAKPVFVDINPKDHTIDVNQIEKVITTRTKAVIPVHLFGYPCDMNKIIKIAKKYKLKIIEDCAQAHGAKYKGKIVPISETGIFSFFPSKNLGAFGDAGAVVTDNKAVAKKVAKLKDHGRTSKYKHEFVGFNYRLDTLQAAILNAKLGYVKIENVMRCVSAIKYEHALSDIVDVIPYPDNKYADPVFHLYVIKTKKRAKLQQFLAQRGIETGIHYPIPLHLQPALKFLGYKKGDFPVTEEYAKKMLSLPLFPELNEDINKVIKSILLFFKKWR